jgi:hypothetical protein
MKIKKNKLGITLQDKYGIGNTKPSDYIYDENRNVKLDSAGFPVKRINSYFTADIMLNDTNQIVEE